MTDDAFLKEVQDEMEREKAILFLKKYGVHITILVVAILASVLFYQWHHNSEEQKKQNMANQYAQFLNELAENRTAKPKTDFKEPYAGIVASTRYQEILKDKTTDNSEMALKILEDYSKKRASEDSSLNYNQQIIDLILLTEKSKTLKLNELEAEVKSFSKLNPVASPLAYEMLIAAALEENNKELANKYFPMLKKAQAKFYQPSLEKRIEIYSKLLKSS